jgi:hypothetical protein
MGERKRDDFYGVVDGGGEIMGLIVMSRFMLASDLPVVYVTCASDC